MPDAVHAFLAIEEPFFWLGLAMMCVSGLILFWADRLRADAHRAIKKAEVLVTILQALSRELETKSEIARAQTEALREAKAQEKAKS